MERLCFLLLLLLLSIFCTAQIAEECTFSCAQNYTFPTDRPTPCCGCCPSSQCHEIPELTTCCPSNHSFCGCLSYRAFCVGGIFGSNTTTSPFGTCYDPSHADTGSCYYNPGPNMWIVCPMDYSACPS